MTQTEKVIKPKLGLLELARRLGKLSQACKIMRYSLQAASEERREID